MADSVQKPDEIIKPPVSETAIPGLVKRFYGLNVLSQRQMISYDDRNFHIKAKNVQGDIQEYTLKITNYLETAVPDLLECIIEIQRLINLSGSRIKVPMPVVNLNGNYVVRITARDLTSDDQNGNESKSDVNENNGVKLYAVHLLTYLPGTTMYNVPYTKDVLNQFGQTLADLAFALKNPDISSIIGPLRNRRNLWSMYNVPKIQPFLEILESNNLADSKVMLIKNCLKNYDDHILNNKYAKELPIAMIHGDYNEHNVIVKTDSDGNYNVYGVLDFTDCQMAPRLFEVSIAMAYAMIESKLLDPLDAAGHVLAGYQTRTNEIGVVEPLSQEEISLIKVCIEARLAQSLTMGAYTNLNDPSNTYVLSTAERGWSLLERLVLQTDTKDLKDRWNQILNGVETMRETQL